MEFIRIFEVADTMQTVSLSGVVCKVYMTWLPMEGVWLFGLTHGVSDDIVRGVPVVPFAPLLSASARSRFPLLRGNFYCIPADADAHKEGLPVDFENLSGGRFVLAFISDQEAAEVLV